MARTMTQEEHKQIKEFIEKKSQESTNKKDSIEFLRRVGFCDKKGTVLSPYKSPRKRK